MTLTAFTCFLVGYPATINFKLVDNVIFLFQQIILASKRKVKKRATGNIGAVFHLYVPSSPVDNKPLGWLSGGLSWGRVSKVCTSAEGETQCLMKKSSLHCEVYDKQRPRDCGERGKLEEWIGG